jgi:hypothetical protein
LKDNNDSVVDAASDDHGSIAVLSRSPHFGWIKHKGLKSNLWLL